MLENCKTNNLTQNECNCSVQISQPAARPLWTETALCSYSSYNQSCGCLCVCVRTFVDALRIVSTDKILCFINTSIISSGSSNATSMDLTTVSALADQHLSSQLQMCFCNVNIPRE